MCVEEGRFHVRQYDTFYDKFRTILLRLTQRSSLRILDCVVDNLLVFSSVTSCASMGNSNSSSERVSGGQGDRPYPQDGQGAKDGATSKIMMDSIEDGDTFHREDAKVS